MLSRNLVLETGLTSAQRCDDRGIDRNHDDDDRSPGNEDNLKTMCVTDDADGLEMVKGRD